MEFVYDDGGARGRRCSLVAVRPASNNARRVRRLAFAPSGWVKETTGGPARRDGGLLREERFRLAKLPAFHVKLPLWSRK
jgi:hypothetical protein